MRNLMIKLYVMYWLKRLTFESWIQEKYEKVVNKHDK
jgi:hypothetical protein